MRATICKSFDELEAAGPGGIYYVDRNAAIITCPGCGSMSECRDRNSGQRPSWIMDRQANTWQPSVHHTKEKSGCGWHGFLTNGEWKPC